MTEPPLDEAVELLKLAAIGVSRMGADIELELSPAKAHVLSIFGRARDLVTASATLAADGAWSAAFILQRPLFEDAVLLASAANSDALGQLRLMARWSKSSTDEILGLAHNAERLGMEPEFVTMLKEEAERRRSKLDSALGKAGTTLAPKFDYQSLAKRTERERDYFGYLLSHQAVHGNELVHLLTRELREDGLLQIGKPSASLGAIVCALAAGSALQIAGAAVTLFDLTEIPGQRELLLRLDALLDNDELDPG